MDYGLQSEVGACRYVSEHVGSVTIGVLHRFQHFGASQQLIAHCYGTRTRKRYAPRSRHDLIVSG